MVLRRKQNPRFFEDVEEAEDCREPLRYHCRDCCAFYAHADFRYEEQVEENERLQAIVDSEDKSEYLEKIAREKLGFIKPNEKVFYDVTPGV